jgi:hypothetical protein
MTKSITELSLERRMAQLEARVTALETEQAIIGVTKLERRRAHALQRWTASQAELAVKAKMIAIRIATAHRMLLSDVVMRRSHRYSRVRHEIWAEIYWNLDVSETTIGRWFGADRKSIWHGIEAHKRRLRDQKLPS